MYVIQHCFICHPSDSTVSEDAGIEPRIDATLALTARLSNNSQSACTCPPELEFLKSLWGLGTEEV
jgi:hypothetical protein